MQAYPLDVWMGTAVSKEAATMTNGDWFCCFMAPYHKDCDLALDKVSWRPQIHHVTYQTDNQTGERIMVFSNGYCSFDDPTKHGGYVPHLMDWAEAISLFPYPKGSFLYGPFSWKDTNKPNLIDPNDWKAAMPTILDCKTSIGLMFQHGFDDSYLRKAVGKCWLKSYMIDDAKKAQPNDPMSTLVPVRHSAIECSRRNLIVRWVPVTNVKAATEKKQRGFLFENEEGDDHKPRTRKNVKRLGRWMDRETELNQKAYENKLQQLRSLK